MICFRGLCALVIFLVVVVGLEATRIAYKKPINGKTNNFKEKRHRSKTLRVTNVTTVVPHINETTTLETLLNPSTEKTTENLADTQTNLVSGLLNFTHLPSVKSTTEVTSLVSTTRAPVTVASNFPVPCTCGVFMASQIKRFSREQPKGHPVVMHELERNFPCNTIGQKQCQTKCLETLVQYLPNSATILCASLERDCRKERAYLFLRNCRNHWIDTNLTAGREYCCINGKPYPCPLV